uniref:DNA mismatch repair protein MutS-like N-terminal domain-containing protein n=1 Tax=Ananas comosus var. bracteatus TaxID=296719 RepID=A0A6V7QLH1_ANACO|nr:unnamed protein product [Ananas comosus var. bracteatus]
MASSARWLCLAGSLQPSVLRRLNKLPLPMLVERKYSFRPHRVLNRNFVPPKKDINFQKMQTCKKPSAIQLTKRLSYTNLLGLDVSLRNGSLKEGTLNMEMLQFKSRFPREVLLCRVGDFYEAVGFDACILVEYAGLNPFGGLRSDSIPKAGCPVVNLRQTLDDLTRCGFLFRGGSRSNSVSFSQSHAHPGSPYVFGLAGVDHDVEFPDPMPVVGISHSAKGYCMISVLETMKTYSAEDGLTEEAIVMKLRTCRYHLLFLHSSLRHNISGLDTF